MNPLPDVKQDFANYRGRESNGRRISSTMVKIDASDLPLLIEAVHIWTGWGRSATPRRDDSLLVNHFGSEIISKLSPLIKSLENEFYTSEAWKIAASLQEMDKIAAEDFKNKHPEIPNQIIQAFAWCYTYDYK